MARSYGHHAKHMAKQSSPGDAVYGLGLIGAFVFFIHVHSGNLWLVILAFMKALVWPAYFVYHIFLSLHI